MIGDLFNIGDTISFDVYPATILGSAFKDVKVLGVVDADLAVSIGYDVISKHANVYPTLPEGEVEDNPRSYQYLLIQFMNGNRDVVGLPWIDRDTVTRRTTTKVVIEIDGAGSADIPIMIEAMAENGYKVTASRIV